MRISWKPRESGGFFAVFNPKPNAVKGFAPIVLKRREVAEEGYSEGSWKLSGPVGMSLWGDASEKVAKKTAAAMLRAFVKAYDATVKEKREREASS